jgi:hypothetical protein
LQQVRHGHFFHMKAGADSRVGYAIGLQSPLMQILKIKEKLLHGSLAHSEQLANCAFSTICFPPERLRGLYLYTCAQICIF